MKLDTKEKVTRYYNEVVPKVTKMVEDSASVLANTKNIIVEFPSLGQVLSDFNSPIPYFLTGIIKAKVSTENNGFFLIELAAFTFDFNRADVVQFDPSANQRLDVRDHWFVAINEIQFVILFLITFCIRGYSMKDYTDYGVEKHPWIPVNDIDLTKVGEEFYAGYTLKEVKEIIDLFDSIKKKKICK